MNAELRITLTPEELNEIVAASEWLKQKGYVIPTPKDLIVIIKTEVPTPSKPVVLVPPIGTLWSYTSKHGKTIQFRKFSSSR